MEITVNRSPSVEDRTLSEVLVNGEFCCYGLEDVIRESEECTVENIKTWKVYGKTAIPAGRYRCTILFSQRFKRNMIYIKDVPGFEGILIHNGKGPESTDCCLLVSKQLNFNYEREAMLELERRVMEALRVKEQVWITYNNPKEAEA